MTMLAPNIKKRENYVCRGVVDKASIHLKG